ncbi:MAG TPA: FAD-dependent oxidoreductase, partial [Spirochaetota bacterium]|nr:FAD-dependent oxidoreductase [Spirochaetota bacterium]
MDFNLTSLSFLNESKFNSIDTSKVYDIVIIGGGPAGLTAAVYAMRKGVSVALIAKNAGGQVAETSGIENYMGYRYINGLELVDKFKDQVMQFSIDYVEGGEVEAIENGNIKNVLLRDGRIIKAKSLIIASGKRWRKLGVKGEDEFIGKGVAYCSICDAPFFAGKKVVVVGGGNSGVEAAIDLAKVAKEVIVIQNLDKLTADKILIDKLNSFTNVNFLYKTVVREIIGDSFVKTILIENTELLQKSEIDVDGIFIEIGLVPNSDFARG